MATHEMDDLERNVAKHLPGLASLSALTRRLDGSTITIGSQKNNPDRAAKRARSRLFLHTGSQR